jgi:hypothetical protein
VTVDTKVRLYNALVAIVEAWDAVPEAAQVPDELDVDVMWEEAREALEQYDGDPQDAFDE